MGLHCNACSQLYRLNREACRYFALQAFSAAVALTALRRFSCAMMDDSSELMLTSSERAHHQLQGCHTRQQPGQQILRSLVTVHAHELVKS